MCECERLAEELYTARVSPCRVSSASQASLQLRRSGKEAENARAREAVSVAWYTKVSQEVSLSLPDIDNNSW